MQNDEEIDQENRLKTFQFSELGHLKLHKFNHFFFQYTVCLCIFDRTLFRFNTNDVDRSIKYKIIQKLCAFGMVDWPNRVLDNESNREIRRQQRKEEKKDERKMNKTETFACAYCYTFCSIFCFALASNK